MMMTPIKHIIGWVVASLIAWYAMWRFLAWVVRL